MEWRAGAATEKGKENGARNEKYKNENATSERRENAAILSFHFIFLFLRNFVSDFELTVNLNTVSPALPYDSAVRSRCSLVSSCVVADFSPSISPHRTAHLLCLIIPSTPAVVATAASCARTDSAPSMRRKSKIEKKNYAKIKIQAVRRRWWWSRKRRRCHDFKQIYLISLERNNKKQ